MAEAIGIAYTVIFVLVGGVIVSWIFSASRLKLQATPDGVPAELWDALLHSGAETQGTWLGVLERLISAVAGWTHSYEIVAGWLAFKVASKWEVWSNVLRLPDTFPGVEPLAYLKARRLWSSNLLMRFLIGSLSNVLLGLAAAYLGRNMGTFTVSLISG